MTQTARTHRNGYSHNPIEDALSFPPRGDEVAERGVVGSILLQPELANEAARLFRASDFCDPVCRSVMRSILSLAERGIVVDLITLQANFKERGVLNSDQCEEGLWHHELAEIARNTPTAAHFRHYADIVINRAVNRDVWAVGIDAARAASIGGLTIVQREALAETLSDANHRHADRPNPRSVRQLIVDCPNLRQPVIHGLLRQGETMNIISAPKVGKSWLVTGLAISIAMGCPWLGTFHTEPGNVLILDNELHGETIANRIPKVADGMAVRLEDFGDCVFVEDLRGRLRDIISLGSYFDQLSPGGYRIIVIDAFYRVLPTGTDENDNAGMALIYNALDRYAARLGCSFVLIHHSTKGNQSGKQITDVGAGAGSQARATDTHLILRPHEVDNAFVLDAAVRSWPPIKARVLRWEFPVWTPDDTLDPKALRKERPRRVKDAAGNGQGSVTWSAALFVERFITDQPATKAVIISAAKDADLSERQAGQLLHSAEGDGLVHRWRYGSNVPVKFATIAQPNLLDSPNS